MIHSHTSQKLLCKLRYKYEDIYEDVFIDGYKQSDAVEDRNVILAKMEELKPYLMEFNKNDEMKLKVYLLGYTIKDNKRQPIILITCDKCSFSTNDKIQKILPWKSDTFL